MRTSRIAASIAWLVSCLLAHAAVGAPRERAIEQIPELMGRILESQQEIRELEGEMTPVVRGYDQKLGVAKQGIDRAASEQEAAEALVDYVEAYASRLDAQENGLRSIEPALVRMRADARELARAAQDARGGETESREERVGFFADQYQGLATATGELADRLERADEAATAGDVLHASWATHGSLSFPLEAMGPDAALKFSRRVEGLYARYQARSNQLSAEKQAVRRLLDMLIERQLAQQLDTLFAGGDGIGLGALLAGDGKSQDWGDLGSVVRRALGLPSGMGSVMSDSQTASLDRLDHFKRGDHR